ncbi:ABC transporter permease [Devosia sp. ZB163]|uniref:ABC transporter permease n=1 Tax=Devosia sp. ZB163 TaxID=3025938 RepID=UPI00236173DA|nr:ABC transporter permease [Devosia sp. ZB163]MDC9822721.1 ABC transporter permease [Devosia sp. ZB163]
MTDVTAAPARRPGLSEDWRAALTGSVASITLTFIVVVAIGWFWVGPKFLSFGNISIIGTFVIVPLIVGAFAGFALLSGVVDLSIGSMVGFSSALFALLLSLGWDPASAGAVTLLACLCFGGINAIAIVGFGAEPIAATLGMLVALRGIAWVLLGSQGSIFAFNLDMFNLVSTTVGGLPLFFLLAIALTLVAALVVTKTRVGRHIRAVGGDDKAAARAGISVKKVRVAALLLSAFGAGLGGIVYAAQLGSAARATGFGLEFQVYAALMIGGYSILRGGVGNPIGGALGLLAVAGVSNILDLKAISPYFVNIIVGLLLLAAVLLDRIRGGDAYE